MKQLTIELPDGLHPSTIDLIAKSAKDMGKKLYAAQVKYGFENGWQDPNWANPKEEAVFTEEVKCRQAFAEHVLKGDPVDVMNYAAFMNWYGWSTSEYTFEKVYARDLKQRDQIIIEGKLFVIHEVSGDEEVTLAVQNVSPEGLAYNSEYVISGMTKVNRRVMS